MAVWLYRIQATLQAVQLQFANALDGLRSAAMGPVKEYSGGKTLDGVESDTKDYSGSRTLDDLKSDVKYYNGGRAFGDLLSYSKD